MSTQDKITYARHQYKTKGATCVRSVLGPEWTNLLQSGLEAVNARPGPLRVVEHRSDGSVAFMSELFTWVSNPLLRDFIFRSPVAELAGLLMGADNVRFFYDHTFLRHSGASTVTAWHNDQPYWPVTGKQLCTVWIPLQPVSSTNGPIEFVVGSHLWGQGFKDNLLPFYHDKSHQDRPIEAAVWNPVPDIDNFRESFEIETFDMDVGDCLVLHPLVVHGSPAIKNGGRRWAYAMRWAGDDVRYAPRVDTQRLIYDPGLNDGELLTGDLFPLIWTWFDDQISPRR